MSYSAPVADLLATMRYAAAAMAAGSDDQWTAPPIDWDLVPAILSEAGAVATDMLLPLDVIGDRSGVRLDSDGVKTASGWPEAYRAWRLGGWNGVAAPETDGGMGLPILINSACFEIWSSANMAFSLCPMLTAGAIEALHRHGSDTLKRLYLPRLVSGEWPGTMNLTEPQAGSDLSLLRTRAERATDGSYRITGQKIYITYGDHDMADNIVHLVLARLPDAPPGTRGISLFLVPKRLVDDAGTLGHMNDLRCAGLERKLGIHGAPTCTMAFGDGGGAVGYLVGEENKGLACMFTMMNNARLAVGLQGVAAAERATQKALAFARERRQGRRTGKETAPILDHPDVTRMLMIMRTTTAAARAICHLTASALDAARSGNSVAQRDAATQRAALLTPVAKAFSTDIGNEVASLGIQVHGGMGYIEDTGAAQIARDVRIAAIYEGTNGIQAIDLVSRKLVADEGAALARETAAMRTEIEALPDADPAWGSTRERLTVAVATLEQAATTLRATPDSDAMLSAATPFLRLFGLARGGTALAAIAIQSEPGSTDRTAAVSRARFFAEMQASAAPGLGQAIEDSVAALSQDHGAWAAAL